MVPAAAPAIALVAGVTGGIFLAVPWRVILGALPLLVLGAGVAWTRRSDRVVTIILGAAFGCAGAVLGAHAREGALHTPLRALLDRESGHFQIESIDVPPEHGPIPTRLRLAEDAASSDTVVTLRADVIAVRLHGVWQECSGGVIFSVGGQVSDVRVRDWRRGRMLEAPVTFRRPARYLDEGVADFERQAALDGITLLGSVKSALLVEVVERGTVASEAAAAVRALVRRRLGRRVAPYGALSTAIVAAVLIGDRSGLPDEVRTRLQAAGTYHVIAISGGNIAILAGVIVLALAIVGLSGRPAAFVTLVLVIGYADVVTAGPSVWRATLVAVAYLAARLLDHRSPPRQAMAVAGGVLACAQPLDVRNAGFLLTFGATLALLEVTRRAAAFDCGAPESQTRPARVRVWRQLAMWLAASVVASAAVEVVLLPVMAVTFSRITAAGLLLNIVAVPLMAVVQIAGLAVVCADSIDTFARAAGWAAHLAATGIVESARLVDLAPWLTRRVPPPSLPVVAAYYGGLLMALTCRRGLLRLCAVVGVVTAAASVVTGAHSGASGVPAGRQVLGLTMLDVGQGDAMALRFPDGRTWMVDTGGSPFGGGAFDIGIRVVEPALWAMGVRSLDRLILTHGDPDHVGGARALIEDFAPAGVWQGVPVPKAGLLQAVLSRAADMRSPVEQRRAREQFTFGDVRVLVLHPPPPDWERQKVRNDDSVVLEVLYRDVALLLTGDIGADIEREIAPGLVPARTRILKVAHHGSRTSTSQAFLDLWHPQIALISCGRGNSFGHPAREVMDRLTLTGAEIYRTDRDGEITVETDGERVSVRTFVDRPTQGS